MSETSYLRFDGMTWPNPTDPRDVQWRLRYGTPTREDILAAASFMHAYAHLIDLPQRERNQRVSAIRAAARALQDTPASAGETGDRDGNAE
jgi:hypothetical protein